jgi:hypothetical protein
VFKRFSVMALLGFDFTPVEGLGGDLAFFSGRGGLIGDFTSFTSTTGFLLCFY